MYEANQAHIEGIKIQFDRQVAQHSPEARGTAERYLVVLTDFVDLFNNGPGADSRLMGLDTTGALSRAEEYVEWAEHERHRVRRALLSVA